MSTLFIILLCVIFSAPAVVLSAAFWYVTFWLILSRLPEPNHEKFTE